MEPSAWGRIHGIPGSASRGVCQERSEWSFEAATVFFESSLLAYHSYSLLLPLRLRLCVSLAAPLMPMPHWTILFRPLNFLLFRNSFPTARRPTKHFRE